MDFVQSLTTETVGQAPTHPPLCVTGDRSLRAVVDEMRSHGVGHVLICREGRLEGIFTERDVLRRMSSGADWDAPVSAAMTTPAVSIRSSDSLAEAMRLMSQKGYRRLPVVNDSGEPQGVFTVYDVVHYLVQHFPQSVYNLPPDPRTATQEREGA